MMDNNQITSIQKYHDINKISLESTTKQDVKTVIMPNLYHILKIYDNNTPKSGGIQPHVNPQHPSSHLRINKFPIGHQTLHLSISILSRQEKSAFLSAFSLISPRPFLCFCWPFHAHSVSLIPPVHSFTALNLYFLPNL